MPHHLSGGQQQRVAVARALAPRPPVVLLDEPFSALDAALRAEVRRDVRQALRADGATALLVTHVQAEALSIADEVAVLHDGRIVQSGPPDLVYCALATPWVAGFVGEAVWLPAEMTGDRARTPLGLVPVVSTGADRPQSTAGRVLLRPEQIEVVSPDTATAVTATVVRRDFQGHDALLTLRLTDGTPVVARIVDPASVPHIPGGEVGLRVRGAARAFPASPGTPE